ncbi:glycosyltransferase [Thalassotalea sp. PS06]|uniref:glycosyltransferase n=1 Tax=Thalassotalea sp. PS06 TaxID=2594005 RepID=UPI00163D83D7
MDECIRSVLDQTCDNWQLVIADDASTCIDTHACLKKWQILMIQGSVLFSRG